MGRFAVDGVQLCSTITAIFVLGHFSNKLNGSMFYFRFVFTCNFFQVNYFSFLDMLGLVIHHF